MVTYYFKKNKIMFTGDFLFKGTIGRCDLEGGNIRKMEESLRIIKEYDNDIKIYPGHGDSSILGDEKKNNPYL
jgi:glyoxylase-like metal-dependent hydrolase (beta-lactamase superfamily II)